MKYLVTGANGFVGLSLINSLNSTNINTIALVRKKNHCIPKKIQQVICNLEDISNEINNSLFKEVDCVIHLAGLSKLKAKTTSINNEYFRVNCKYTTDLAKIAAKNGVKRFLFLSSVKANGNFSKKGTLFQPNLKQKPIDPYGLSKYKAEKKLLMLKNKNEMEIVIIRSPIIYGPGVKGNFLSLIDLIKKGIPLPFGAINNKRSFIAIDNLINFIMLCSNKNKTPKAANEIFIVSDDNDISTKELCKRIADAYNIKSLLIPVPLIVLRLVGALSRKRHVVESVLENLQVDSSKAKQLLKWKPLVGMNEQLQKIAIVDKK